jgi:hypothetical protein
MRIGSLSLVYMEQSTMLDGKCGVSLDSQTLF